jgi:putative hydrolase of HD superfamily
LVNQFFKIVANLKKIKRKGWYEKVEINFPESVADHSYSLTGIAMVLSDLRNLDTQKVMKMCVLHDLAESIIGDLTPDEISRKGKQKLENKTMKKILSILPNNIAKEYFEIWSEFQEKKSDEAKLVHESDKFEMALQASIYLKEGFSKEKLKKFFDSADKEITNSTLRKILNDFNTGLDL